MFFITQWPSAKHNVAIFTIIFINIIVITYEINLSTVFLFSVISKHNQSFKNSQFLLSRKGIGIPIWIIRGKFPDIFCYTCIYSDLNSWSELVHVCLYNSNCQLLQWRGQKENHTKSYKTNSNFYLLVSQVHVLYWELADFMSLSFLEMLLIDWLITVYMNFSLIWRRHL
jgi:hypothetical protein